MRKNLEGIVLFCNFGETNKLNINQVKVVEYENRETEHEQRLPIRQPGNRKAERHSRGLEKVNGKGRAQTHHKIQRHRQDEPLLFQDDNRFPIHAVRLTEVQPIK